MHGTQGPDQNSLLGSIDESLKGEFQFFPI
jgi:hypothetical protein